MGNEAVEAVEAASEEELESALFSGVIQSPPSVVVPPVAETPPVEPPAAVEPVTPVPPVVATPEPPTPAAVVPPVVTPPAVNTSAWPEEERLAHEIGLRNPDLRPSEALQRAKDTIAARTAPVVTGPTLAERLAEIDTKLDEAGSNEGLMTPEITQLIKERGDLAAQIAVETREQQNADAAEAARLAAQRKESRDRVPSQYENGETVNDPNSPIGQQISLVIEEMQRENNPVLLRANAPEEIVAIANSRLPLADRLKPKAPVAETQQTPGTPPAIPPTVATPGIVPVGPVPVSGAARSADVVPVTPQNVRQVMATLSPEEQEAALFGRVPESIVLRRI